MEFKKFIVSIHYIEAAEEKTVNANPMTIGRSYAVDLPLIFTDVSRNHLKVYWQSGELFVEDLGSKNGTFINGVQIEPNKLVPYREGDRIRLGKTEETLSFRAEVMGAQAVATESFATRVSPSPAAPVARVAAEVHLVPPIVKPRAASSSSQPAPLFKSESAAITSRPARVSQAPVPPPQAEPIRTLDPILASEKSSLEKEVEKLRAELSELTSCHSELSSNIEAQKKYLAQIEKEAEEFFIARQNELLKERAELEKLKERRQLEVEVEMAKLMAKRHRENDQVKSVVTPLRVEPALEKSKASAEADVEVEVEMEVEDPISLATKRRWITNPKWAAGLGGIAALCVYLALVTNSVENAELASVPENEPSLDSSPQVAAVSAPAAHTQPQAPAAPAAPAPVNLVVQPQPGTPSAPAVAPEAKVLPWEDELRRFVTEDLKMDSKVADQYLKLEASWAAESKTLMKKSKGPNSAAGNQLRKRERQVSAK